MPLAESVPIVPAKSDFPDWLSPMLVKELRQGVRTRVFVSLFILLQVAMLLTISLTLLIAAGGEDTSDGSVFFWVVVGGSILFTLPLSALNSVGGEIKANTLELIFLTRQTAFRIVAGKWLATFVQVLLFVCTVLPYLVLRYFVGGVNLTRELATLGTMLVVSALLTALAVGISAYPARLGRSLAFFGCLSIPFFLDGMPFLFGRSSVAVGPGIQFMDVVVLLLCAGILLVLVLEAGAAKIAPPAENHSAAMRLLAVGGLAVSGLAALTTRRPETIATLTLVVGSLVCAGALCEQPRWISSLYRPYARRGWWGRLTGRLIYPGWHTGIWFTLLLLATYALLLAAEHGLYKVSNVVRFLGLAGTILFPAAVVRGLFRKTERPTTLFFAVVVACLAATMLCAILDHNLTTSTMNVCAALPISTLIYSFGEGDTVTAGRLLAVAITTGASLAVLLVASCPLMKTTRRAEDESLLDTRPPLEPAPEAADATLA